MDAHSAAQGRGRMSSSPLVGHVPSPAYPKTGVVMSYETLQEQLNNVYRAACECLRVCRRLRPADKTYRRNLEHRWERKPSTTKDYEALCHDVTALCKAHEEITKLLGLDEVKPGAESRALHGANSLRELLTLASDGIVNVSFPNSHEALCNGIRNTLRATVSSLWDRFKNHQKRTRKRMRKQGIPVPATVNTQGMQMSLSDEIGHMMTLDWCLNVVHHLSDFSYKEGILDLEARLEREYIVACDKLRQLPQSPSKPQRQPKKGKVGRPPSAEKQCETSG